MRLIWGSRHLKCPACGESFVFIRPRRSIGLIVLIFSVIFLFMFMRDLNELMPTNSGRRIGRGFAINDTGYKAATGYLEGEYHALLSTPKSKPIIDAILNFFNQSVKAGSLVGKGSGNSAKDRLNSIRDMLETTGDLIAVGDIEDACEQLKATSEKCDNDLSHADFVSGSAIAELDDMILDLRTKLKCE